jgi:hypothetical protein
MHPSTQQQRLGGKGLCQAAVHDIFHLTVQYVEQVCFLAPQVLLLPPLAFLEPRWWLPASGAKPPKRHQLLVTLPLDSGANALAQEVLTCWGRHLRSNSSAPPFVLTIMGVSPSWQLPGELVGLLEQQANLQQKAVEAVQQQQQERAGKRRHLQGTHYPGPSHYISAALSDSWHWISSGVGGRLRRLLHLRHPASAQGTTAAAAGGGSDSRLAAVLRALSALPPVEGAAWQEGWRGPWLRLLPAWHGVASRSGGARCQKRRQSRQLQGGAPVAPGAAVSPCPLQTKAALRLAQERAAAGVHVCLAQRDHTHHHHQQQQQEEAATGGAHVEVERCALPAMASAAVSQGGAA